MSIPRGRKLNPNTAGLTHTTTVSEFTTYGCRVELRRGRLGNAVYLWVRVTIRRGSNYHPAVPPSTVQLVTPAGTTQGLPYGNLNNWTVGSSGWTPAICVGNRHQTWSVTFKGASIGDTASKTVTVS